MKRHEWFEAEVDEPFFQVYDIHFYLSIFAVMVTEAIFQHSCVVIKLLVVLFAVIITRMDMVMTV